MALQATQIPAPTGFVNDFANVIPAESEARITRIAEDVRAKSGGDIAVATIPDLGDAILEDVSLRMLREWGVGGRDVAGGKARNVGVLILIVPKETNSDGRGRFRIETGLGAEGFITDAESGRIQDEALPFLRQGDYGSALELTALRVAERFAGEFGFTLDTSLAAPQPLGRPVGRLPSGTGGIPFGLLLPLAIMFFFFLSSLGGRRRRRRGCGGCMPIFLPFPGGFGGGYYGGRSGGWGGGGFGGGGGGFGGFGGGWGGGGGSSRSW